MYITHSHEENLFQYLVLAFIIVVKSLLGNSNAQYGTGYSKKNPMKSQGTPFELPQCYCSYCPEKQKVENL